MVPEYAKTWVGSVNETITAKASAILTNATLLLVMIARLTGTGTARADGGGWVTQAGVASSLPNPVQIVRSCNSLTVSVGTNLWLATGDLIWANNGTAHSWIVLDFVNVGIEVLIACSGSSVNGSNISVYYAPYGKTGHKFGSAITGTTTTNPTATTQKTIINSTTWGGSVSSAANVVLHVEASTDGECYRVFMCNGGQTNTEFSVEKFKRSSTALAHPAFVRWQGTTPNQSIHTDAYIVEAAPFNLYDTAPILAALSTPYALGTKATADSVPNDISTEWTIHEAKFKSNTASQGGWHGQRYDYWTIGTAGTGSTGPNTGLVQDTLAVTGNSAIPWFSATYLKT